MIQVNHSISLMALSNWTSAAPFLFHQARLWKTSGRRLDTVEKIREEEVMSDAILTNSITWKVAYLIEQLPGAANELVRHAANPATYESPTVLG
jgi:hypothetical protein